MRPLNRQEGVTSSEGGVAGIEGAEAHGDGGICGGAGYVHDNTFGGDGDYERVSYLYRIPADYRPPKGIDGAFIHGVRPRNLFRRVLLALRNRL